MAGLVLLALGAFEFGCMIWWGTVAEWDLTAKVDTARIVDSSAASLVFGYLIVGSVLSAAGLWVLLAGRGGTRRRSDAAAREPRHPMP